MENDSYKTIAEPAQAQWKERSSKFLCYAYPVQNEDQVKELLEALRKKHYDATHHCYAWRLGSRGESFRANDDGEPSSTAGRPILGQLLSADITDTLIVVVRYFGGTKLGVSGLIAAYKESAAAVIEQCVVVERTVNDVVELQFSYIAMNEVMKAIKELQPTIISQGLDNLCRMELSIRRSKAELLRERVKEYIVNNE